MSIGLEDFLGHILFERDQLAAKRCVANCHDLNCENRRNDGTGFIPVLRSANTIRIAEAKPVRRAYQDVDADGDIDLLLAFNRRKLKLKADMTKLLLTGETKDGEPFLGESLVSVIK